MTQLDLTIEALTNATNRIPAASFKEQNRDAFTTSGLYSWWGDREAQLAIGEALGQPVGELLYVGQTGATSKTGVTSDATLWSRLGTHIGGAAGSSTFRRSLTALLEKPLALELDGSKLEADSKRRLTAWVGEHLAVRPVVWPDRDRLGVEEERVLALLDPPLNLDHMDKTTPGRRELTRLRKDLQRRRAT